MNIIFAGTPDFSVPALEALYEKGYNIDLVLTQEDRPKGRGKKMQYTPVKEKALELGLEVYQPSNINSEESLELIRSLQPDVIVVVAYGQIFREELLNIPKHGCINIHASLLPKYRGAAPINWVIINGEDKTGITIMEMEKGLDSGKMFYKKEIDILEDDTNISIHDSLCKLGGEAIVESLEDIVSGKLPGEEQNHELSSYAPMLSRETGKIDWNKSNIAINNLVKGVMGWPSATSNYKGDTIKIHKSKPIGKDYSNRPGEIIKVSEEGVLIQTGSGSLLVTEIQFPNKKKMKVRDYIAGNVIEENIILTN